MAFSAHKSQEQVQEHHSKSNKVEEQARHLAELIRQSGHLVCFTGAGVSTAAGIPDFRGPQGVWTLRAQGKQPKGGVSTTKALPTPSHMALVELQRAGQLKFLISQNCDGLHRRSGYPSNALAELHGNTNLEKCRACGNEYLRDFGTRRHSNHVHDHETDRKCLCGQPLYDSIINFSENLPDKPLTDGFTHARKADVMLVLGSSLTVTPAADMPRKSAQKGGKLVVVNLQKTPLDELCHMRVFAKTDDFMSRVMAHLNLQIPEWRLRRRLLLNVIGSSNKVDVFVEGVEMDGTPATVIKSATFGGVPMKCARPDGTQLKTSKTAKIPSVDNLVLTWFGHYEEPDLTVNVEIKEGSYTKTLDLSYNPFLRTWTLA